MRRTSGPRIRGARCTPTVVGVLMWAAQASGVEANTRIQLFGLESAQMYSVRRNSVEILTAPATAAGALLFTSTTAPGDRFFVAPSGVAAPPSAPTGVAATGSDVGCLDLAWDANPEADVIGYRAYWGDAPVPAGAPAYDDSADVAGTAHGVCGLADGTYYAVVRAINAAGMLSGTSLEVSASVSNGDAQPPLPPPLFNAAAGAPGCASLVWVGDGNPQVVGYIVDYGTSSVAQGQAPVYDDAIDVGNVTAFDLCALPAGTYYFAVRARNHLGMLSGYSVERAVIIVTTAVFVTGFEARAEGYAVRLRWQVRADEPLFGFRLYRSETKGAEPPRPVGALFAPGATSAIDTDVSGATTYRYELVVVRADGSELRTPPVSVTTPAFTLHLEQNAPNPFNPTTAIAFFAPAPARARLDVFDARGALVTTLLSARVEAGRRVVFWDGTDARGRAVASGAYFCRLQAGGRVLTRKMLLVK